jgi:hypothetical protein
LFAPPAGCAALLSHREDEQGDVLCFLVCILENIRDVSYGEDASQIRTGNGPQVMAILRNLAIGILKPAGHASIAAACRYHARDATRVLAALGLSPA